MDRVKKARSDRGELVSPAVSGESLAEYTMHRDIPVAALYYGSRPAGYIVDWEMAGSRMC
jgi:hypothetical protein